MRLQQQQFKRQQHSNRRRLVIQEPDATAADPGCRECEELYARHRGCLSAVCYSLSIVYLICLVSLIYLYTVRQSRNLSLGLPDLLPSLPADPADCFQNSQPMLPAGALDPGDAALLSCARALITAHSAADAFQLLRLQRIDGAALLLSSAAPDALVLQFTDPAAAFPDDCGRPSPAQTPVLCQQLRGTNLTVTRLTGGGCPLTHFLELDIQLRLRLALKLLQFSDELDLSTAPPGSGTGDRRLLLSPAVQLDDFGVDRRGQLVLINAAKMRLVSDKDVAADPACYTGSHSNHALIASLLHDAYTFVPTCAAVQSTASVSPPSLARSFLRGWSDWRFSRRLAPAPLPPLAAAWRQLPDHDRRAERLRLLALIQESLHADDPAMSQLWWAILAMSIGCATFALLRYWLCYKIIVCLEYLCL